MTKIRTLPYGYTVKNGRTVIEPSEARCIRKIFDDYISGASINEIADELTAQRIPFTIKSCEWNKSRIWKILENTRYTGDSEFDPIIDESVFSIAAECKKARANNSVAGCSKEISVIKERVKCEHCGHPMVRRVSDNQRIREAWVCQNSECGASVRITDFDLSEKVRILMNRVIQNANLMIPATKPAKLDIPEIEKLKENINREISGPSPSESLVLDLIGRIASEEYKGTCSQDAITARLAKQRVSFMTPQTTFNETYFNDMVKSVLIGNGGKVRIITKTDADICDSEKSEDSE